MELATLSLDVINDTFDILNVSQNAAKLVNRVTSLQDQDSSQIHSRILSEKKRTEEWVNQMRGDHGVDLGQHLTQEEGERISFLLLQLNTCYKKLDRTLQKRIPSNEKSESVRLIPKTEEYNDLRRKSKSSRLIPRTEEYNDLNNIVDTLTTINKFLNEISISPPRYSGISDGPASPSTRPTSISSPPSSLVGHVSRASTLLEPSSPGRRLSQVPATIMEENSGTRRPAAMYPVRHIWKKTLLALTTISTRRSDYRIARAASRLKLWGAGILEMAFPLDEVFDAAGSNLPLRKGILRVLVDILVWEEQELNKLGLDELNSERSQDRQMAKEITALLGTDDLISMALESWKDLVEEFEYDQVAQAPRGHDFVPGLVELLFGLLPPLRAARRDHCLRLARDKAHPSMTNVSVYDSANTAVSKSFNPQQETREDERKEIERNLQLVAELLAKRDKLATKRSKKAEKYAPWFEKERVDLRAYFLERRSGKSMHPEDLKDFEFKAKRLRDVLTEYVGQISKDPNIRDKLANLRPGRSKDKYSQIQNDVHRAEKVIGFVDASGSSK